MISNDHETKNVAPRGKAPATTANTLTGWRKAFKNAVNAVMPMQKTTMKLLSNGNVRL